MHGVVRQHEGASAGAAQDDVAARAAGHEGDDVVAGISRRGRPHQHLAHLEHLGDDAGAAPSRRRMGCGGGTRARA